MLLLGLAGIAASQLGYLELLLSQLRGEGFVELDALEPPPAEIETLPEVIEQAPVESRLGQPSVNSGEPAATPEPVEATATQEVPDESEEPADDENLATPETDAVGDGGEVPLETLPAPMSEVAPPPPEPVRSEPLIDFSQLPRPDVEVAFSDFAAVITPVEIVLREDAGPVVADFIRHGDITRAMTLRLEEIGYSGNR